MSFHSTVPTFTVSALELAAGVVIVAVLTWIVARTLSSDASTRTAQTVHRELDRLAEEAPQVDAAADLADDEIDPADVVESARDAGKVDTLLWFIGRRDHL